MNKKTDLINYRREKARATLEDAKILFSNQRFNSSVNRIYYAMFYEVSSLLLLKNLTSSKHTGTKALFQQYFVKPGEVDKELGKFYSTIFEFRQRSDYEDFVEFEEYEVNEWLKKAENFLEKIEELINRKIRTEKIV